MDCASQHANVTVLNHCARLQLHVILIPSGMTWLLQPLDSHVFAGLKRDLAQAQSRERGRGGHGPAPVGRWVDVCGDLICSAIVHKTWTRAMQDNGLCGGALTLRSHIQDVLGAGFPLILQPPSNGDMSVLAGGRRAQLRRYVLSASLRHVAMVPAIAPAVPLPAVAPAAPLRIAHAVRLPSFRANDLVVPHAAAGRARGSDGSEGSAGPPPPAPADVALLRRTRSGTLY